MIQVKNLYGYKLIKPENSIDDIFSNEFAIIYDNFCAGKNVNPLWASSLREDMPENYFNDPRKRIAITTIKIYPDNKHANKK